MKAEIRRAGIDDLPAICRIYADEVLRSTSTMDTVPWRPDERIEWLRAHREPGTCVRVVEVGGRVVAWGKVSRWSPKAGYASTVEVSLFVEHAYRGRGIGRRLLADLIDFARESGRHVLIGRIESTNTASLELFGSFGFETVGTMREVGRKFDRWLDVTVVQRILPGD